MEKIYAGAKIRTLRRNLGLTQHAMARAANLSTSYLNQLENDQRPLTTTAISNLSKAFSLNSTYFSPESNARFVADLHESFSTAGLSGVNPEDLHDLAARYPDLARGIVHLARALTDMTTLVHIQQREGKPLPPTLGTEDFANFAESATYPSPNPQKPYFQSQSMVYEEVRDFFYERRNHISELDTLAEEFAASLGPVGMRVTRLTAALDKRGISVKYKAHDDGPRRIFINQQVRLRIDLTEAQQCFELAMQWCYLVHDTLIDTLARDPHLSPEAQKLTRVGLAQYFAAAVVMPYSEFLRTAKENHFDIDRIRSHFGTSFETTCHRLSSLQRENNEGIPFFFIRTDRAGNISKRQSATSFHFSRSGGACPKWVIHRAFETPGRIIRQVAQMPDGRTYLWIARTVASTPRSFSMERTEFAIGLGCDIEQAKNWVYSKGLELAPEAATPIGAGCRICERDNCHQRAFPALGLPLDINENFSPDLPYRPRL
ncbi:MAG: short-chain fatty acyl-CoA regulator family protein [Corynebacterium sp.]|uniref:short-chain fatty acyl-CoA regulator family protein n=1 Tax=Corynebacterium sp. TaxID=1720 RepID=UPI0026DAE1AC|nr:short-chain fatty acyl-CoA regulator family protein [Corynebacterium sp.]MDO4760993.1 short-chain fatty acyl-CoA regulator family protein [Corynebacterium sp.]